MTPLTHRPNPGLKTCFSLALAASLLLPLSLNADARTSRTRKPKTTTEATTAAKPFQPMLQFEASIKTIELIGTTRESKDFQTLVDIYRQMLSASNRHDIASILKHYSPQFISGDNLTLANLKSLITDTWQSYPTIQYDSRLDEIHLSGDWATIETHDSSFATIAPKGADAEIAGDLPGTLSSQSKNQLYFKKIGDEWLVMGDSTTWEQAEVRYGVARNLPLQLTAPEQVKAGENYSTTLEVNPPKNSFAIVAIANQALTYPHVPMDDKFRPMNSSTQSVQRVLKANMSNRNEIVSATIGLPSVLEGANDRPSIGLEGIATIVKRVNVIPTTKEEILEAVAKEKLVRTSASGKINLEKVDAQLKRSSSIFGTMNPEALKNVDDANAPSPNLNDAE